jgi:gliding motility-associated-like protein
LYLLLFLLSFVLFTSSLSAQLLTTIAGTGTAGYAGDSGPAKLAQLNVPVAMCFDADGNMYIADHGNQRVRKVAARTGIITTIAGTGTTGFSGDGGLAVNARLNAPTWVCADKENHLYIVDYNNLRVRCVDLNTGIITTVAGNGTEDYVNGALATQTGLLPFGLAVDAAGNLYISQHPVPLVSFKTNIISKVNKVSGRITTFAGNGQFVFAGDGGPALQASFSIPTGMSFDASGNLYVADAGNQRIRRIAAITGIVTTIAGNGSSWNLPDGQPAVNVGLNDPTDVKVDKAGDLIFVDRNDARIRKVNMTTGIISTVAGNGYVGLGADCVLPTTTTLNDPRVVDLDASGNICFTEQGNNRIRSVIAGGAATISITPSSADVCLENVVTFTAHATQTGTNPVYQWKKNDKNVGTNSPTYTDVFVRSDVVVCVLTPGTCGNMQVSSNPYMLTGSNMVAPVVNVTSTATEICPGTQVRFTATNASGSLKPSYQWYVNNNPVGTDTTVFTSKDWTDGAVVQCRMTVPMCDGGTTKAYSNPVSVHVYTDLHPAISIQTTKVSICKGALADFTAVVKQAGANPNYQWLVNGIEVGANTPQFRSTTLLDGDVVSCSVTTDASNTCTPVRTAVSNAIRIKVDEMTNPSVQISSSKTEICQGDSVYFSVSLQNIDNVSYGFEWQVNGSAVSRAESYTATHLMQGDRVSCLLHTSGCTLSPTKISNSVTVVVNPLPDIQLSPADTTVAAATQVRFNATVSGAGFQYSWSPANQLGDTASLYPITKPLLVTSGFKLHVISPAGCSADKEAIVKVITKLYMPNAFTPNNDGKNDLFRIPPGVSLKLKEFAIYNRWGNKVFSTNRITDGWDGTNHGRLLDTNSYVYIIDGQDDNGKVLLKGTVLLIR